jgi:hypothetical protein
MYAQSEKKKSQQDKISETVVGADGRVKCNTPTI